MVSGKVSDTPCRHSLVETPGRYLSLSLDIDASIMHIDMHENYHQPRRRTCRKGPETLRDYRKDGSRTSWSGSANRSRERASARTPRRNGATARQRLSEKSQRVTVLVDTSVWVDHLRQGNKVFSALLEEGRVQCHPQVIGELACGNLRNRKEILGLLDALPRASSATFEEALFFLESENLHGRGLGWIDVQLLASARLSGCPLWTLDRRLAKAAKELGVDYSKP